MGLTVSPSRREIILLTWQRRVLLLLKRGKK